jgi:hypothetical protein
MPYKPGDFVLGIIDVVGIIMPGAVLIFLHYGTLQRLLGIPEPTDQNARWIGFFVVAYVFGQLLHGAAFPMNRVADNLRHIDDAFFAATQANITLPEGLKHTRSNFFYHAVGYLRVTSSPALWEVEREMADSKLFRGLAIVFTLHFLFVLIAGPRRILVIATAFALLVFVTYRFAFLQHRTYRRAFQLYLQAKQQSCEGGASGAA